MLQKIKAIKKNLRKVKIIDNKYFSDKSLPGYYSVSIVIATLDRPDDLKECLSSLFNQTFCRKVEIIIVDNNPLSGLTSSVVNEFPEIKLVQETRKGLSYARNKGIIEAKNEIIISIDDDVIISAGWLESLIAPFIDEDVAAVTGNVYPFELVTKPQKFFEEYGGLGRGEQNFIVNKEWFDNFIFRAVPTWEIGATANAAFRSSIFKNSKIGLLEEVLGPGMPSGVGEDTYLFYKILKEGKSIVYLSDAYVMHKH
ncbi:MAG TPA: glycosyltransferase, partial [Ignavibacteriaceae bacterium]|nr:glycosyltransferase [Ignavibacteriaceae bacterium]